MKKNLLFLAVIFAFIGYSCSSDDDSPKIDDDVATLVGEWQLETIDFSVIVEDAHPIYGSDFCVMEYIAGYSFNADHTFIFVVTEDKFGTNSGVTSGGEHIWFWEGDVNGFSIAQPNPMHTNGYIFAPKEITNVNVSKVNDEWILTFDAELHLESKGTFTFVKKEINTENHRPVLTLNGEAKEPCGKLD